MFNHVIEPVVETAETSRSIEATVDDAVTQNIFEEVRIINFMINFLKYDF